MLPVGRIGLYTLLVALPIAVEIPPDTTDTGSHGGMTRITAIGGAGTYALIDRGCENQVLATHPVEFREAAGAIEHEFPGGLAVGVRGGAVRQTREDSYRYQTYRGGYFVDTVAVVRTQFDNQYFQPTIALEQTRFGLGVGYIWAKNPFIHQGQPADPGPSFHLRLGRRDGVRFEASYMENLPLYSGGGYLEFGVGMHLREHFDLTTSFGSGPFEGPGLGVEMDYRVRPNWSLLGRARLGHSGNENQSGGALGISYSTRPPMPVYREPLNASARRGDHDGDGWRSRLEPKQSLLPPEPEPPAAPKPTPATAVVAAVVIPATDDGKYPKYGSYQSLDSLAVPIARTDPVAPDTTIGTVFVATLVARTGEVVETRVIQSVPALDAAAVECVRRWTFRPAIDRGRAVASWVTVPVRFGSP